MEKLQQQLPVMMVLAHQRTEGARVELAGMLADVFLADNVRLSLREEELLNELIDQLMQARSPTVRAQLIEKFADSGRMPRKVALGLANDNIDFARKILVTSAVLTDDDLISVVHTQSRDHARAIAERKKINEAVVDALVVTGDIKVMQLVAENLGATLSHKAVEILTDAARFTQELREPVLTRAEMTVDGASKLYWWVSQDLRRYALRRYGLSSGQVDQALARTIDQLLGYHQLDRLNDEVMEQVADWLSEREAVSVRILPQVLRLGHFRLFNILLARLAEVELSLVDTIVTEIGGRGLAVVCRAMGINKSDFVSIFLLSRAARGGEQIVHPRELSQALAAFDRLAIDVAQQLLRNWKQDATYLTDFNRSNLVGA